MMFGIVALLSAAQPQFRVVALGAAGGLEDGDLSAYWVDVGGNSPFLLDAGTLVHGMDVARAKGTLKGSLADVNAIFISHPHFDHVAGLVIGSAADDWTSGKRVAGLSSTIDALRDHVFNNVVWANFGDDGAPPVLSRFHYLRMTAGRDVHFGDLDVTAYPLSHAGITSTAFVVDSGSSAIVYCGDTGPDSVEHGDDLAQLFTHVAGLVRGHKLAALFLESSYPSARDDKMLFGHLTPAHLLRELHALAEAVDADHAQTALKGVNVVVTHIKPAKGARDAIIAELNKANDLGVRFLFPKQGDLLELSPP
jgi:3',5'-cyclic-nucleotide phosphodiesterase